VDVDELLGAGSAGPGKSLVLLMDPMFLVPIEHERMKRKEFRPGHSTCKILHLRRQLNELGETVGRARRLFPYLDEDVKFKEVDGKQTATFASGMQVIFGGCKDLHDYVQYQGHEYVRIYYDELGEFEQEQYEQINTRNRSSDPVLSQFVCIRAATNPVSNWVRDTFYDPAPKGRAIIRRKIRRPNGEISFVTRMFLPATLYDNPDKAFVRQYELKLLSRPTHIRNSLLYGEWYSILGGYYADAWRKDLHVIRPFKIPGHWPRFKILDWGFKQHGCCLWFAVDEDGNLICEREFIFRLMVPGKVAERIRQIEEDMGLWGKHAARSKVPGFADTNLWEDRGSAAESKAEVMARAGVPFRPVDKSDKTKNAQRFYERLIDHHDGTTLPGIVFFEDCRETVRVIPGIMPDPNDTETPLKTEGDHPHDCVLYACASRAKGNADDTCRGLVRGRG
jgi:hypothetical protein